jgi:hypothetical protein
MLAGGDGGGGAKNSSPRICAKRRLRASPRRTVFEHTTLTHETRYEGHGMQTVLTRAQRIDRH